MSIERRKHPRVYVNVAVQIKEDDPLSNSGFVNTQTLNLSSGGIYCPISRYLDVLTRLQITLLLPIHNKEGRSETEFIRCIAIVVRIEPEEEKPNYTEYRVGLFFSQIKDADRKKIERFVLHHSL